MNIQVPHLEQSQIGPTVRHLRQVALEILASTEVRQDEGCPSQEAQRPRGQPDGPKAAGQVEVARRRGMPAASQAEAGRPDRQPDGDPLGPSAAHSGGSQAAIAAVQRATAGWKEPHVVLRVNGQSGPCAPLSRGVRRWLEVRVGGKHQAALDC